MLHVSTGHIATGLQMLTTMPLTDSMYRQRTILLQFSKLGDSMLKGPFKTLFCMVFLTIQKKMNVNYYAQHTVF